MRAREFIVLEVLGLAAMLGAKSAQPGTQPPAQTPKNVNATAIPVGTQGSNATVTPSAASAQQTPGGGTQTSQNGVNSIPSTGGAAPVPVAPGTAPAAPGSALAAGAVQKYQPGQQIDLPGLGKVKVGATTSQGTEIDATNIPSIGSKIIIPSR